ncbi:DNA repair and recombination protein RDH54 [Candida viswanathii]|uniref:DNA repair and recombination protein RDH54 n=1 Tax=Candida viswanathii TaxID=5486 RepID=A0A367XMR9_9ASCO|nr:DNA repair and recombination protein RDH54 [Candida viswanathii]
MSSQPNAPFKAPRLVRPTGQPSARSAGQAKNPTIKRALPRPAPETNAANSAPAVKKSRPSTPADSRVEKYIIQWRKKTTKKNKTWDGDGDATIHHLESGGCDVTAKNSDNKSLGKRTFNVLPDFEEVISLGTFEIELDEKIGDEAPAVDAAPKPVFKRVSPVPSTSENVTNQFKKVAPPTYTERPTSRKAMYNDNTSAIALPPPPNALKFVKVNIDPHLATKLRPHQVEGVSFLYECLMGYRDFQGQGCLLADEMGLGKTLMTITTIWTLLKQNPFPDQKKSVVNKVLVVCPATLISNWRQEFRKWLGANKLNVLTLNNAMSNEKQDILNFGKLNVYQVLVVNYEKITIHYDELSTIKFDLLVCDEGHRLKNSANKVLKHLIKLNIPRKIVLTGTPIQNELIEFHTLISFLNPGVLPDLKTFQKNYVNPISRARDVNCFDPEVKRKGEAISQLLIRLTLQFILRRTQAILSLYLTSKTDVLLFVPPSDLQLKLFKYIINLKKFNQIKSGSESFTLINLFKKICNSPSLLVDDAFFQRIVEKQFNLTLSSGKISVLIPLLLEIVARKEKIVLISNYTQTLDLLERVLVKINLTFSRLDGSTPTNTRNSIVKQFNTNPSINVFLLSSKSGGMGINLVGASRLILFDNDWNPATDLQSMSRIHRDGQQKPCFIYRIFTTGCIDEKIFQRQLVKNKLSSKFLDNDSSSKSDLFDESDLKNIFEVDTATISNTHDLLECSCNGDGSTLVEQLSESQDTSNKENGEEEEEPPFATQSWVSALELQQKMVDNGDILKKSAVKSALSDYQHYDPNVNKNLTFDMVLHRLANNPSFQNKKLPITFIMLRVSNQE